MRSFSQRDNQNGTFPNDILLTIDNDACQQSFRWTGSYQNPSKKQPVLSGEAAVPESLAQNPLRAQLTTRELDVLVLVASGYSRREIGDCLDISLNTAATHIRNIYRKLDINCIAEAVSLAVTHRLV